MSYNIELNDGRIVRRHIDHIRPYIGAIGTYGYDEYQDEYSQAAPGTDESVTELNPASNIDTPQLRRSQRVLNPRRGINHRTNNRNSATQDFLLGRRSVVS